MCQAKQLHTLQIFHTGMTEEGHATLLTKLPNLKVTVLDIYYIDVYLQISR